MNSSGNWNRSQPLEQWLQLFKPREKDMFIFPNRSGKMSLIRDLSKGVEFAEWPYPNRGGPTLSISIGARMIRRILGRGINGDNLWECQEIVQDKNSWWLGTGYDIPGIIYHHDMQSAVKFFLERYPQTDTIDTSWGTTARISSLIPGALAELAIKEINPKGDNNV